jgi:hypothetical protein
MQLNAAERSSMHQNAPECTRLQLNALVCSRMQQNEAECRNEAECSRMQQNAAECSRMQQNAAECSRMQQNAAECTRLQQHEAERSRMQQNEAEYSRMQQIAADCSRLHQNAAERTRMHCSAECNRMRQSVPQRRMHQNAPEYSGLQRASCCIRCWTLHYILLHSVLDYALRRSPRICNSIRIDDFPPAHRKQRNILLTAQRLKFIAKRSRKAISQRLRIECTSISLLIALSVSLSTTLSAHCILCSLPLGFRSLLPIDAASALFLFSLSIHCPLGLRSLLLRSISNWSLSASSSAMRSLHVAKSSSSCRASFPSPLLRKDSTSISLFWQSISSA